MPDSNDRPRASRGHTWDPWPCCGERPEATGRHARPKGEICTECKRLIEIGRLAEKLAKSDGGRTYKWVSEPHWYPGYYGPYDLSTSVRNRLRDAMFAAVNTTSTTVAWDTFSQQVNEFFLKTSRTRVPYNHMTPPIIVLANPAQRESLNALDDAIRGALEDAFAEGKRRGRSAVLQLASGEMSLKDFDSGEKT